MEEELLDEQLLDISVRESHRQSHRQSPRSLVALVAILGDGVRGSSASQPASQPVICLHTTEQRDSLSLSPHHPA